MIYLDYASNTPMSLDAIDSYVKTSKEYMGAISSNNGIGKKSKEKFIETTKNIADLFSILPEEIIYTSGASDANNMALIGAALANHKKGKHIIVSKLEQQTIYGICDYLKSVGFEISYVDNDNEGLVKFSDLKKLIREDTILVSICAVNGETGVRQPLKMLRQIIKKENENTIFHSDLSLAIGKTPISFKDIDLASVSAHLFNGPVGIGFLYKNTNVKIIPLEHGNPKFPDYKPGLVSLPLVVSMYTALKNSLKDLEKFDKYVSLLNERIRTKLSTLKGININYTKYSIPYVLNISFDHVSSETLANILSSHEIYVNSLNNNELSSSVLAIYKDKERCKRTMTISLSHITTVADINRFLETFELEYNKLFSLMG